MKRVSVMSRNRRITKPKQDKRSREYFERAVAELGEALRKLPAGRPEKFEADILRQGDAGVKSIQ